MGFLDTKVTFQARAEIDRMDCQTTMKIVILNTILKANNLLNNQLIYPSNNTDITQKDLLEYQLIQNEKFHLLSGIPLLILGRVKLEVRHKPPN